jgi:hypothetical protein
MGYPVRVSYADSPSNESQALVKNPWVGLRWGDGKLRRAEVRGWKAPYADAQHAPPTNKTSACMHIFFTATYISERPQ